MPPKLLPQSEPLLDSWGRRNRRHADRPCLQCGKLFHPKRDDSKYCSRPRQWKIININQRYYLAPTLVPDAGNNAFDVCDRARDLQFLPSTLFSNACEKECREWVLRNCEEPVEHTEGPWRVVPYSGYVRFCVLAGDDNPENICDVNAVPTEHYANAHLISTAPKLLALLEQYHASMPTKESGKLICDAKGWLIQD